MSESFVQIDRLLGRLEDAIESLRFDISIVNQRDRVSDEAMDDLEFEVNDILMYARAIHDGFVTWQRSKR